MGLKPDNLRNEVALIGILIVLLGIALYTGLSPYIAQFLRPIMLILGATLVLSAAFADADKENSTNTDSTGRS